jgi:hypothetical protein
MRKWTMAVAAISSALIMSGRAEAANCASVSFGTPTAISGWNPLNNGTGVSTFTATATRDSNSVRSARIVFADNQAGTTFIGTAGPQYEINDSLSNQVSGPLGNTAPTSNSITQFSWGSGQGSSNDSTTTFTIRVLPSASTDWVSGTNYTELLQYSIQCFGQTSTMGSASGSASTISLTIPSLLQLTTGSPQTIDFGSFTTATQTLQVGVKSTSSINLSVTSGDQMVLAGAVAPYPNNAVIPYTMTLNGDTIANGTSLSNRPRAGVSGSSWPLVLTLTGGVPSGKLAGSYSDTITLTLTPGT